MQSVLTATELLWDNRPNPPPRRRRRKASTFLLADRFWSCLTKSRSRKKKRPISPLKDCLHLKVGFWVWILNLPK